MVYDPKARTAETAQTRTAGGRGLRRLGLDVKTEIILKTRRSGLDRVAEDTQRNRCEGQNDNKKSDHGNFFGAKPGDFRA